MAKPRLATETKEILQIEKDMATNLLHNKYVKPAWPLRLEKLDGNDGTRTVMPFSSESCKAPYSW